MVIRSVLEVPYSTSCSFPPENCLRDELLPIVSACTNNTFRILYCGTSYYNNSWFQNSLNELCYFKSYILYVCEPDKILGGVIKFTYQIKAWKQSNKIFINYFHSGKHGHFPKLMICGALKSVYHSNLLHMTGILRHLHL